MNPVVPEVPIIAIVDDDASIRRSLLRVVQTAGYRAEAFASGREFLDWLPRNRAACLVLDIHMSEMTGFDLQDRLAVPIIFITAHDDVPTLERIAKSGAAGHLRKPFDAPTVLGAIQRAVRANQERDAQADGDGHVHADGAAVHADGGRVQADRGRVRADGGPVHADGNRGHADGGPVRKVHPAKDGDPT